MSKVVWLYYGWFYGMDVQMHAIVNVIIYPCPNPSAGLDNL